MRNSSYSYWVKSAHKLSAKCCSNTRLRVPKLSFECIKSITLPRYYYVFTGCFKNQGQKEACNLLPVSNPIPTYILHHRQQKISPPSHSALPSFLLSHPALKDGIFEGL